MADKTLVVNCVNQWTLASRKKHANPFSDVELDVVVSGPGGATWRVPAFWAGGTKWAFRFAAPKAGRYTFRTECSDASDTGLHDRKGAFRAAAYHGDDPLYRHGRIRVAADRRHFEHTDGRPFFWLGDTWWMGLTGRLEWKKEFASLTADRVKKGFTVVQIVAGLYPDMEWGDPRGANEAGLPYDKEFDRVNPEWFDFADRKIAHLCDQGIAPCIVGGWGYFFMWMGLEKAKRHWRYLVARYGAYPVFWCLAGEGTMPYYVRSSGPEGEEEAARHSAAQKTGWTQVARYVRSINAFGNPLSIHPTRSARDSVEDDSVLDFNMLQTGHGGYDSLPNTLKVVQAEYARQPHMPVVQSEVNYEGICSGSRDDVQRATFWVCELNGVAGYTYGANGIWQVNQAGKPFGASPHGAAWGNRTWQDACSLPGSSLMAFGKRLLEKYPWWRFEPHPEWSGTPDSAENWRSPQAAGIPGQAIFFYFHNSKAGSSANSGTIGGLGAGATYRAKWIDPEFGVEYSIGKFTADAEGHWTAPGSPIIGSILLVVQRLPL